MNIDLNFLKPKKNFRKKNFHPNSDLYWQMVLVFSVILVLLSFVLAVYLFMEINKDFAPSFSQDESEMKTVQKDRINKVLEYFSLRAQKSQNIRAMPSPIVDPSL